MNRNVSSTSLRYINRSNDNNATTTQIAAGWTSSAVFNLVIFFAILFTNGIILIAYYRDRQLSSRTFSYYLINLALANIVHGTVEQPFDVVYLVNFGLMESHVFCVSYLYTVYVTNALLYSAHMLISINRVWAVGFPVSYRHHHSNRTAILICCSMWAFNQAMFIPFMAAAGIHYRPHISQIYCLPDNSNPDAKIWTMVVEIGCFILPGVVVAFSYPFIWWKQRGRYRVRIFRCRSEKLLHVCWQIFRSREFSFADLRVKDKFPVQIHRQLTATQRK